jgi:hypothetical protein
MKRFLIVVYLAAMGSSTVGAGAISWFPWLHTRPKPVLLEDQAATSSATRSRVAYRKTTAAYAGASDRRTQPEAPKSGIIDVLTRGWHSGAQPSKSNTSK